MENLGNHIESLDLEQVRTQVMAELAEEIAVKGCSRRVIEETIRAFDWARFFMPELDGMIDEGRALLSLLLFYAKA